MARTLLFLTLAWMGAARADAQVACTSKTYGGSSLFTGGTHLVDPDANSSTVRIASGGSLKVFHSAATNYNGDSPGVLDVYYSFDYSACAHIVSTAAGGGPADGDSFDADVSGDGRWVTFASNATNLVSGDGNGVQDVFLYEVSTGTLTRISKDFGGDDSNGPSASPSISRDGRYVAFHSRASDLVASDANGAVSDVFRYDRLTDSTILISLTTGGAAGDDDSSEAAISGDGNRIAFTSLAKNLDGSDGQSFSDVFVRRVVAGVTTKRSVAFGGGESNGASYAPAISRNGEHVSYTSNASNLLGPGLDTNGVADIFAEELATATRRRVSVNTNGQQANAASSRSSVSNAGDVAYDSDATNLVQNDLNGDADAFLRIASGASTVRVSVDSDGVEAQGPTRAPDITADGCTIAFASAAPNLVAGRPPEATNFFDVFCHRPERDCPILCIGPELEDINKTVTMRATVGPPNRPLALFLTHVNDAPFSLLLFFGNYDSQGKYVRTTVLPNDPGLRGLVSSFRAYALPADAPVRATNPSFLGIQD